MEGRPSAHEHRRIRVGVVFGGRSAEHEVSLQSARNVLNALDPGKYEAVLLGIDRQGRWQLQEGSKLLLQSEVRLPRLETRPDQEVALVARGEASALLHLGQQRPLGSLDVVFPVLHGPFGEDGSIQGLCKLANLPCVGAGILGSAVGMDKEILKRLLREAGIPTARFLVARRASAAPSFADAVAALGCPVFVKPANLGSSVGVGKAEAAVDYDRALEDAFQYDTKVLVEESIAGRELECSVLGNDDPIASIPGEIVAGAGHDFYDYEAKYIDETGATLLIPAPLDPGTTEAVRALAVRAFVSLGCWGMARVDLFLRPSGQLLINEINTIPGFTSISMYPKLWEASGMPPARLVDRLIELALERHAVEAGLRTTP